MTDIIGKVIQGYRILEPIESEPRGFFFKACSSDGKQVVTIRFLPGEVGRNPRLQERLRIAIQNLTLLKNPTILPVLASGVYGGYPYLILPFNSAGSLKDRIVTGVLSAINTGEVIGEIASALSEAHQNRLIHGNLNPGDILFDEEGKIHLSGFAEASVLRLLPQRTSTSTNGSEGYQAPEVGKGDSMSALADQYSLGLIALELLTGLPLDEAIHDLEYLQCKERTLSTQPSRIIRSLSIQMVAVLTKALSNNPSDRFPSIEEMIIAFQRAMGIEAPKSETEPVRAKVNEEPRQIARKRSLAPLLVVMLCLLVSVPAVFAYWRGDIGGTLTFPDRSSQTEAGEEIQSEQDHRAMIKGTDNHLLEPTMSSDQLSLLPTESVLPLTEEMPNIGLTSTALGGATSLLAAKEPTSERIAQEPTVSDATSSPEPTLTPTATLALTTTATSAPTFTPIPTLYVTIAPEACKKNSNHRDYCTPTPMP